MSSDEDAFVPRGFLVWQAAWREVQARGFVGEQPDEPECSFQLETAFSETGRTGEPVREALAKEADQHAVDSMGWMEAVIKRADAAQALLRGAIFDGSIKSYVLLPSGRLVELDGHVWGGYQFPHMALSGLASVSDGLTALTGRILVRSDEFDRVFPPHETLEGVSSLEQLPPYLRFMVHAARHLGLAVGDKRAPKEHVVDWLTKNWPLELGRSSTSKIEYMATFLRHPEDERGGHYRPDRKT